MTDPVSGAPTSNFIRQIIDTDLKNNKFEGKRWQLPPATLASLQQAPVDTARIRTRFPPEPNGFLHIGHAKSIWLNFGLAQQYGGICHLRFDDTNPEKEEQTYVDAIIDAVHWLGYDWNTDGVSHLFFASDYFEVMYGFAVEMIKAGHAYVDEQSPDEIRETRGTLTSPGTNSPWRDRPVEESLQKFQEMREGKYPNGSLALRAKVDMTSPNINLRDPVIYRIRHAEHHRTGNDWCIYPMYSWAHPIEDALEGITHSICTLEFEDQRPFYDWTLEVLADLGCLARPLPRQFEFARMNLNHVITSKRKLLKLVQDGRVSGWDDPRMPTLAGLRRRGYTPGSLKLFCERTGVSKANSRIDYSVLEQALRDDLDPIAPRAVAILDPLKLVITNWPEDQTQLCTAPRHPHNKEAGQREFMLTRELWIERDDFMETPPKKYFRLFPGNLVRLKYGYIVRCTGCVKDENGQVIEVHAEYLPDTRSGTPGSDSVKVRGNITWVSAQHAIPVEFALYDRLFLDEAPEREEDFLALLNPDSMQTVQGWLEPGVDLHAGPWQFERLGYFAYDDVQSADGSIVINRITTLKDNWAKRTN
ncbi:glutamine--tRNA ligase/YqeY domain fusion protein [Orrella sp. 11846]|uniref:glutamine--tRNA ligase/YqeY domain fusion protein n=1 Tax=Orrella sp. 11846 TaxID=3409913 RepID=UPI003B5C23CD